MRRYCADRSVSRLRVLAWAASVSAIESHLEPLRVWPSGACRPICRCSMQSPAHEARSRCVGEHRHVDADLASSTSAVRCWTPGIVHNSSTAFAIGRGPRRGTPTQPTPRRPSHRSQPPRGDQLGWSHARIDSAARWPCSRVSGAWRTRKRTCSREPSVAAAPQLSMGSRARPYAQGMTEDCPGDSNADVFPSDRVQASAPRRRSPVLSGSALARSMRASRGPGRMACRCQFRGGFGRAAQVERPCAIRPCFGG